MSFFFGLPAQQQGADSAEAVVAAACELLEGGATDLGSMFSGVRLSRAVLAPLCEKLLSTSTLTRLSLSRARFEDDEALAGVIASLRAPLATLQLAGTGARGPALLALSEAVAASATLTELDLGGARFDAATALSLSQSLSRNKTIFRLAIGSVTPFSFQMGGDGEDTEEEIARDKEAIVQKFREQGTELSETDLPYLLRDLAQARAGVRTADRWMREFAAVVAGASGLRSLVINELPLTDGGALALAAALRGMPGLNALEMP